MPFDLAMSANERTLLVSGPNTGGKTVLLKALGLISAMAQSGIPAPVGAESRIAVFDDFFADIGDEQSIEASLSTFSAHLKNLSEILRLGDRRARSCSSTSWAPAPIQSKARRSAGRFSRTLTTRGTMTIATTHLGALKELATQVPGVVNASLQFDAVALAPTYRLIKGIPGRSYGISIARRLELPEDVVARAEERLPQQERDVAALIEQLEQRAEALTAREQETAAILDDARERMADLAQRERNVRERERRAERESRQEARATCSTRARRSSARCKELKKTESEALEEAAREARNAPSSSPRGRRRSSSDSTARTRTSRDGSARERLRRAVRRARSPPAAGWTWRRSAARSGRVIELRDASAVVAVGAIKLTVPLASLTPSEAPPVDVAVAWTARPPRGARAHGDRPARHARRRGGGRRAAGTRRRGARRPASLRIIHGKGTGALRERVAEMLRKDTRVKEFRMGAWNEGGAGVTVAEL